MADASGKVPVIACAKEAWQFLLSDGLKLLPAALIVGLATAGSLLFAASGGGGTDAAATGFGALLLTMPIQIAANAVFMAAVLRRAVRGETTGASVVRFGGDEVRLIGVTLSLMLVFVPFGLLIVGVVSMVVIGQAGLSMEELAALSADAEALSQRVSDALGPSGELAFSLFVFIVIGLFMVIAARLSMVQAATIAERRVVIFQTWSWSTGNVLRIIAALLLVVAPAMLIGGLANSVIEAPLMNREVGGVSQLEIFAVGGVSGVVSAMLGVPQVALGAILFRGLRPAEFVAK